MEELQALDLNIIRNKCGNFWPDFSPLPFLTSAEYEITGEDNLMRKAENDLGLR